MTTNPISLATGYPLGPETWADFVTRLRHDCVGEGVRSHMTADVVFVVQARRIVHGIDADYTDNRAVYMDEDPSVEWFSPEGYWADCDADERGMLNESAEVMGCCSFLELTARDQWHILGSQEGYTVTGWVDYWESISLHFTNDAANAFTRRKSHDYRHGLRVVPEAQHYCWEFNAVKAAILDGRVVFNELPHSSDELIKLLRSHADLVAQRDALAVRLNALEAMLNPSNSAGSFVSKWTIRYPKKDELHGIEIYNGTDLVCKLAHHFMPSFQVEIDYARRIVACVNACDGLSNEALEEPGVFQSRIGELMGELREVKLQRDNLLAQQGLLIAALEDARPLVVSSHAPVGSLLDDIDAALAAAITGESQSYSLLGSAAVERAELHGDGK